MAQLIPGDASWFITRMLILTIWSVTPLSWFVILSRATRYYLHHYTPYSLDAKLWHLIVHHAPRPIVAAAGFLASPRWRWLATSLYLYCLAEVLFSIYYWHLCRSIQRPGPRPLYGRRFLRGVFSQALQAGLKASDSPPQPAQSYASAVSISRSINSHPSNPPPAAETTPSPLNETSAPPTVRQRLGRLRAASFVPQFVTAPIAADDPRAIKFQQDQARWFYSASFEQIDRREVMHWLAWSLFATELEELEAERDGLALHGNGNGSHHAAGSLVAVVGARAGDGLGLTSATPSTFNSPMPPSVGTFGGMPPAFSTGAAGGGQASAAAAAFLEEEDVRGARAKEGEWDPTTGDRLRFLEYCLEFSKHGKAEATRNILPVMSSLNTHNRNTLVQSQQTRQERRFSSRLPPNQPNPVQGSE